MLLFDINMFLQLLISEDESDKKIQSRITMKKFIVGRVKSTRYALQGFWLLVRTEDAIITHSIGFVLFIGLGIFFKITFTEWMFQLLAFGVLLAIEGLNTGLEKLWDFVHPDFHVKIGEIKDVAAGAVTMIFFAVVAVLGFIYIPYLIR